MKIKTSELTGKTLDWAVASCLGYTNLRFWREPPLDGCFVVTPPRAAYGPAALSDCAFSASWSRGGPLIEREGIAIHPAPTWTARYGLAVQGPTGASSHFQMTGPTSLIAAMRCFVAAKLGEEVDVPEELLA